MKNGHVINGMRYPGAKMEIQAQNGKVGLTPEEVETRSSNHYWNVPGSRVPVDIGSVRHLLLSALQLLER